MNFAARPVRVESPGRLHLGFVDLNGSLGRKFGSLGLALEDLSTVVTARAAPAFKVSGIDAERARSYARASLEALGADDAIELHVVNAIPAHAGLGSGTQLALTVAVAIAQACRIRYDIRELATLTGRGLRSGIGIGVFESGGFVVDGGQTPLSAVPPVLARFEFPPAWRVILIEDHASQGLSGSAERAAFEHIEPMRETIAAQLCRLTLMGVFPALIEHDFAAFCRSIAGIQAHIGAYFAPYQGGSYTSEAVAEVVGFAVRAHGLEGVGQSSWGPTGFAFVADDSTAYRIRDELSRRFDDVSNLRFSVHSARNHGALVESSVAASTSRALG